MTYLISNCSMCSKLYAPWELRPTSKLCIDCERSLKDAQKKRTFDEYEQRIKKSVPLKSS